MGSVTQQRRRVLSVMLRSTALLLAVSLSAACSDDKQPNTSATSSTPLNSSTSTSTTSTTKLTKTAVVHVPFSSVKVGELANSCESGEFIYDPCWTETDGPDGPSVICMSEPWNQNVKRLLTGTTIAAAPATPGGSPWGVELADGQRCRVATGAHDSLDPSRDDDADVVDHYCSEVLGLVPCEGSI